MERAGSGGWSQVDQVADPQEFIQALAARSNWDTIVASRRRLAEALHVEDGHRLLEVGCGTGDLVRDLARLVGQTGVVIGIDKSQILIDECRKTSLGLNLAAEYRLGDVSALEFSDGSFDGCCASFLLMHLSDPRAALAEMVRVTRSGGRIALREPDQDTWTIDASDRALTRALLTFRTDGYRDGWMGRQLFGLCHEAGLTEVTVLPVTDVWTDWPDSTLAIGGLRASVERAEAAGVASSEQIAAWWQDLEERRQAGRFFLSMTHFTVAARKP
jgi:ubiquinone/menaquinone biosynthesis C-methylase UbiE